MVPRTWWLSAISAAFKRRPVVWLSGVRRAGKTTLAKSLPHALYFDCERPSVRRMLDDPEQFLEGVHAKLVVLDEIHRLRNPSELLKIAADHFPATRLLATGSSTITASRRFRDTLVGRKADVWLTPLTLQDSAAFGDSDPRHRMLRGGLPEHFLARDQISLNVQEWMDNYWAKDVQALFRIADQASFQRFAELLFIQSGGMFEASAFARPCEVSRGTIRKYLFALDATFVVHVVRPFSSRRSTEIVAAPKVYAFDTGFVCHYRELGRLQPGDLGFLWEHIVLNEIHAVTQSRRVHYWRDKRGHEVDFVLRPRGKPLIAIECKWSASAFEPAGIVAFTRRYPDTRVLVVSQDTAEPYRRTFDGVEATFIGPAALRAELPEL